ncbi:MAG: hypothetical protein ACREA0_22040 [bacterium]
MYARNGIPEYWLANLIQGVLEVYRHPQGLDYTHRVQDIGVATKERSELERSELDRPPPRPLPLGEGISYWTADTSSPPNGRGLRGGRSKIVTSRASAYRKPKRDAYISSAVSSERDVPKERAGQSRSPISCRESARTRRHRSGGRARVEHAPRLPARTAA